MSASVLCSPALFEGVVMRLINLSSCGVPVSGGSSAQIISDGFMKVQAAPQYATGNRVNSRKANGTLCLNFKVPDQFTNMELTADFCIWHPGIPVYTLNATLLTSTQSPTGTGFEIGTYQNGTQSHWSLEIWQPPPQSCDATGTTYYPYHAWPHVSDGKLGQFEISSENQTVMQIMGNTFDASPLWTAGNPYLGRAPAQGAHYDFNLQNQVPPPSACVIAAYP